VPNFLEQLVAEWYEYNGYFVNRNVHVGRRRQGGWECELDVVAFNPRTKHLVHIEPSTDADRWDKRETRFRKKFDAGQKYIPQLFESFKPLPEIERIALFVFGNFMQKIRDKIKGKTAFKSAIPEKYVILRTLQFAAQFWK
jgi:hypothetical protein